MSVGILGDEIEHFLAESHTVTANQSNEDLTATTESLNVKNTNNAALAFYVVGDDAGSSGVITVAYQVSVNGVNWVDRTAVALTLDADNVVEESDAITKVDLVGINRIRLKDVSSTDAAETATLNVGLVKEVK